MAAPEENETSPPTAVAVPDPAYSQWLRDRQTCVTATDIAKICGLSRFGNALDVYLDKIGEAPAMNQNANPLKWGRRAEPMILAAYAEDVAPLVIAKPWTLIRSTREPLIGATLDAQRTTEPRQLSALEVAANIIPVNAGEPDGRPVDAKNIRHAGPDWGEHGTDVMPLYYAAQLVGQMFVTEKTRSDLAVLFGGSDDRVYTMEYEPTVADSIIEKCVDFWRNHVEKRIPPPVDGSESYTNYLKRSFKSHTDVILRATPEQHEMAVQLSAAEEQADIATGVVAALENRFKAAIGAGNAKAIEGPGGKWKFSWTMTADSTGTDWKEIAHQLALIIAQETGKPATHLMTELVDKNQVVTKKGSRRKSFSFSN